jgi:hypothetical protein
VVVKVVKLTGSQLIGQTVEEDSIGALLLYDDGYEFEWDEPERNRLLEERLIGNQRSPD